MQDRRNVLKATTNASVLHMFLAVEEGWWDLSGVLQEVKKSVQ